MKRRPSEFSDWDLRTGRNLVHTNERTAQIERHSLLVNVPDLSFEGQALKLKKARSEKSLIPH